MRDFAQDQNIFTIFSAMDFVTGMELFAVLTGLVFIMLLINENIWCWPIGMISSIASIYVFYSTKLYAESILYFYYILIGIYGWVIWSRGKDCELPVKKVSSIFHTAVIFIGILLSYGLGLIFRDYTDEVRPFADSSSTIFSFIASYMEAQKILSSWIFWIIINAFSIWLYLDRGLKFYTGLMVIYFLLSIVGYIQWQKKHSVQIAEDA